MLVGIGTMGNPPRGWRRKLACAEEIARNPRLLPSTAPKSENSWI